MSSTEAGPPATVGGRYTLGDLIGRGGAADVFRARDELLGRDVAIKMFNAAGSVVAENASRAIPPTPRRRSATSRRARRPATGARSSPSPGSRTPGS